MMKKLIGPGSLSHIALLRPKKQPKDFTLRQRTNLSERISNLRERLQRSRVGN
ncbi:hypothetical protein HMPREF0322_03044, partial [Desulfitobacterium hafniense DP7]